MIKVLVIVIIIALGILIGPSLMGHQGIAFFQVANYDITMRFTTFCALWIISYLILWFILKFIGLLLRSSLLTHKWFNGRKLTRARKQTGQAWAKLAEGDHLYASRLFSRSAPKSDSPALNYLLAAESAQRINDNLKANEYLKLAEQHIGQNHFVLNLSKARILIEQNKLDQAKSVIEQLLAEKSRHPEVLRLARTIYSRLNDFQSILDILPQMYKIKLYSESTLDELKQNSYIELAKKIVKVEGTETLYRWWSNLDKSLKIQSSLYLVVINLLIKQNDDANAQKVLLQSAKQELSIALIALIEKIKLVDPDPLEKLLLKSIKEQPELIELNQALGRLYFKEGKWQRAVEQLSVVVKTLPNKKDYSLLAQTYDKLNQYEQANAMREKILHEMMNESLAP